MRLPPRAGWRGAAGRGGSAARSVPAPPRPQPPRARAAPPPDAPPSAPRRPALPGPRRRAPAQPRPQTPRARAAPPPSRPALCPQPLRPPPPDAPPSAPSCRAPRLGLAAARNRPVGVSEALSLAARRRDGPGRTRARVRPRRPALWLRAADARPGAPPPRRPGRVGAAGSGWGRTRALLMRTQSGGSAGTVVPASARWRRNRLCERGFHVGRAAGPGKPDVQVCGRKGSRATSCAPSSFTSE
ncbi:hypothetical protein P7K49_031993 [Saguinus oedipus]|uniref:Basic proline-rich protein-like n=1 Tax=Saguinus oedipus TaxID=9490 RepID=A0ABQ9TWZ8_SAGOE|nr:hypothetical protein P7K49_031993 [Saguinus oedipus]